MAFICKLFGCGADKEAVKPQQQQQQQRAEPRRAFSAAVETQDQPRALARPGPSSVARVPARGRREVDDEASPSSSRPEAKARTEAQGKKEGLSLEEKVSSSREEKEPLALPPPAPPFASSSLSSKKPQKQVSSPALPKAWQLVAHISSAAANDDEPAKQVDLEVCGESVVKKDGSIVDFEGVEVVEDLQGRDDDDEAEIGSFAAAWRAFKQQEDAGFGALRDYVSSNYVMLLRKMLSPARETYATAMLGPLAFDFRGRQLQREDFVATNERGFDLQCSLWMDRSENKKKKNNTSAAQRKKTEQQPRRRYCVVYVHDVGGSRLGSLSSLGVALDAGAHGFCAFDSTACGRSEGLHVSFGHFERYDVAAVCAALVADRGFTDVVLWGRGAGAVAAVRYAVGLDDPPAVKSYLETQSDALYDSVFGSSSDANTDGSSTNGHHSQPSSGGGGAPPQQQQHHKREKPGAGAPRDPQQAQKGRTRSASSSLSWTYPENKTVTVDAFSAAPRLSSSNARTSSSASSPTTEEERVEMARSFASSLELVVETSLWVVSKPALVVVGKKPGGVAARLGVREGDVLCGVGTSTKLPHSQDEFAEQLVRLARKTRSELKVHFSRTKDAAPLEAAARRRLEPYVKPAGLILDCVVDSPSALIAALRDQAARREPILASLAEPLLQTALDVLFHSVKKRANFDPTHISLKTHAPHVHDVPALFGANDFSDVDRGIPRLADLSGVVFDAYGTAPVGDDDDDNKANNANGGMASFFSSSATVRQQQPPKPQQQTKKLLVKYNAPLRLALRGTLDAMSSKFLNKSFVFLQTLPGLKEHADKARANFTKEQDDNSPPRWVVTTRPWAQKETIETIDDYESAQIGLDSLSPKA